VKLLKHPATIIAAVALFVALGGGAAYASGLINGSQIKNHSIAAKKLTKSAVKSLHGLKGAAGATGATGATGTTGATGPSSVASAYVAGPVAYSAQTTIASLTLAAGKYLVQANTTIADSAEDEDTVCYLIDSSAGTIDQNYSATAQAGPNQTSISLIAPLTSTGSTVQVACLSAASSTAAYYTHITALKVGSVTGTAGHNPGAVSHNPKVTN
jgi:hypothetical protein